MFVEVAERCQVSSFTKVCCCRGSASSAGASARLPPKPPSGGIEARATKIYSRGPYVLQVLCIFRWQMPNVSTNTSIFRNSPVLLNSDLRLVSTLRTSLSISQGLAYLDSSFEGSVKFRAWSSTRFNHDSCEAKSKSHYRSADRDTWTSVGTVVGLLERWPRDL